MRFAIVASAIILCVFASKVHLPNLKSFKDSASGLKSFKPAPLPCIYTVSYLENLTFEGTTYEISGRESAYGRHFSHIMKYKLLYSFMDSIEILRADIHHEGKPDSGAVFDMTIIDKTYSCLDVSYVNPYYHGYTRVSDIYDIVNEEWYFSTKSRGVWNGTECDVYSTSSSQYYVDENGHVIGYVNVASMSSYSFFYSNESDIHDFMVPKSCTCYSNYSTAYETPDLNCSIIPVVSSSSFSPEPHPHYSSASSHSSYSRNPSSVGLIVFIVVACIITLAVIIVVVFVRNRRRVAYASIQSETSGLVNTVPPPPLTAGMNASPSEAGMNTPPPPPPSWSDTTPSTLGWNDPYMVTPTPV